MKQQMNGISFNNNNNLEDTLMSKSINSNIDEDIELLQDYILTRRLGSYIIIAVDDKENDYYIAHEYKNKPNYLIDLLSYVTEELEEKRIPDA